MFKGELSEGVTVRWLVVIHKNTPVNMWHYFCWSCSNEIYITAYWSQLIMKTFILTGISIKRGSIFWNLFREFWCDLNIPSLIFFHEPQFFYENVSDLIIIQSNFHLTFLRDSTVLRMLERLTNQHVDSVTGGQTNVRKCPYDGCHKTKLLYNLPHTSNLMSTRGKS